AGFVLDLAAAPGSKTSQLSALMHNQGVILANEPSPKRHQTMLQNLARLGVMNVVSTQKDGRAIAQYFPNFFDSILLDAPCSGEGTIRKDFQALLYWNDKKVESCARLQRDLISDAFSALKPGGELVYSTCTMSPEENEDILDYLLAKFPQAYLIPLNPLWRKPPLSEWENPEVLRCWPQLYDNEGFFVAKIGKNSPTEDSSFLKVRHPSAVKKISQSTYQVLQKYAQTYFAAMLPLNLPLYEQGKKQIFLQSPISDSLTERLNFMQNGFLFADIYNSEIKISHFAWLYLWQMGFRPQQGFYELNASELKLLLSGQDLALSLPKGPVLFIYEGHLVASGKSLGDYCKNYLPRSLAL
ncbi:MAG TPA: NOL1/NOP2/sun family putative RNA methylase, partial [Candidatus Gracilibacteria bacterium]|nr:NOL1/NOP2/sun family putative RNA methylase [Candidatus Gracilibacteria bacterium]